MKTHLTTRAAIPALALIAWLLVPQTGHCFYNPSTGRWMSRDPVVEEAFAQNLPVEAIEVTLNRSEDINLYGFIKNRTINDYDPIGLCPKNNTASGPTLHFDWSIISQHNQTFDLTAKCPTDCQLDTRSVKIDISQVWNCLNTSFKSWIAFLDKHGWDPYTSAPGPDGAQGIGGLKGIGMYDYIGSPVTVTWYARTRLASHFYIFADSCWSKAKMTYSCKCCPAAGGPLGY